MYNVVTYCYYVKGEGKDAVRGDINGIHQHYRTDVANPNRAKGNHPLNGRILKSSRTYPGTTVSDDPADPQYRAPELMNMDLGAISARKSAPNDGSDPFTNTEGKQAYSRSKQNSDAGGMFYQWGRKDSFTFATSSLHNGELYSDNGKYPVKIYNGKSELIYQEDEGRNNLGKSPAGGVIAQNRLANSMMETVKKPNVFYYPGGYNAVISQVGHSKELWDYYWTSYSRGTDGRYNPIKTWHNTYLDGYIVLRSKSIYDPCPYGYRTPTNGTYNNFSSNPGWALYSYIGGIIWNDNSWFGCSGSKRDYFMYYGREIDYRIATDSNNASSYTFCATHSALHNNHSGRSQSWGIPVRCIEDATVKADQSEASASY